jgi:hypothetical protein
MIEAYFIQIEQIIQEFPTVCSSTLHQKVYNIKQGYISGSITFENGYRLEFVEVKDIDVKAKIKYRYQYLNDHDEIVFRYDNAPHHRELPTFPHHKHNRDQVEPSQEPTLFDILLEIAQQERRKP